MSELKTVTKALKEGRCVALEGDTEGFFITEEGAVVSWTEGRGSYLRVLQNGNVTEIELDRASQEDEEKEEQELRLFLRDSYPESRLTVSMGEELQSKLREIFLG